MLSLDVAPAEDWWAKYNRAYMVWELGKLPEVVIEIVSNTRGGEIKNKINGYASVGVPYYVVYDPALHLKGALLRVFGLYTGEYVEFDTHWLVQIGLGLILWDGVFEGRHDRWLRWCDEQGQVIPTGAERAEAEHERAEAERERAEAEHERAERMLALLREHGIEPTDNI